MKTTTLFSVTDAERAYAAEVKKRIRHGYQRKTDMIQTDFCHFG